jgi:drug/metabolite transporter (DMT)-like permease
MENIKKRLGNLLSVKSLVTITLTVVFAVLALRESISGSEFLTIFTVVIGFYFGTQRVNEDKNG